MNCQNIETHITQLKHFLNLFRITKSDSIWCYNQSRLSVHLCLQVGVSCVYLGWFCCSGCSYVWGLSCPMASTGPTVGTPEARGSWTLLAHQRSGSVCVCERSFLIHWAFPVENEDFLPRFALLSYSKSPSPSLRFQRRLSCVRQGNAATWDPRGGVFWGIYL